ncbi:MAG: hypothetical protein HY002_11765 [Candidatus Rokubacteria bacterium]|nr:hypothetical protein [Candidatus Rokubacteria bacterium]
MDDVIRLSASETVRGRPFTDPRHNADDLLAIGTMAAALRPLLSQLLPDYPRPLVLQAPEREGRQHRVVICDERRLRVGRDLGFVGFFATKRPGLDASPLTTMDDELILEFPSHPGILSYSSLEFPDGNWGNLILVDPPEAKDHWRTSERHAYAAHELAPKHYAVIRLHNGVFPGGLLSGRDPILVRSAYHDFQGPEPWRAERQLLPP